MRWRPPATARTGGLGLAAVSYVAIDYLRFLSPALHSWLMPALWSVLALVAVSRVPFYKHWSAEFRSVLPFLASMLFMLFTFLFEALSVRSVTAVLGLDWHRDAPPLPDTGQWIFLALNEQLHPLVVEILRAHIIGLHHFLMLFMMLAFSVLFDSVKAPGLGLGARYMFTMAIGRFLRAITFVSTILPSARPWCASARFRVPRHPHYWAQKYYVPYASNPDVIHKVIDLDMAYADAGNYIGEYRPDWGSMSFLINFLRPTTAEGSWYNLLKKAGGGCNDLIYSGHILVAVLTAMAWTEAYGGFSSGIIWLFVLHSAQREIRERHHYTVDCVVGIYVGILLWKMTGFIWSAKENATRQRRLSKLEKIYGKLIQAAKDSDMYEVRELLKEVEMSSSSSGNGGGGGGSSVKSSSRAMWVFACAILFSALTVVFLALTWTSDG